MLPLRCVAALFGGVYFSMEYEKEIWRPIENFPNYEVSNYGRIKNVLSGNILSPYKNENGYMIISLHNGSGNNRKYRVHRLVAEAFIPNPNNYPIINHKDENKSNNHVSNLEWCNKSYNALYGSTQSKLRAHKIQPIQMIDNSTGEVIKEFDSIKSASELTGIHRGYISNVCRGKHKTAHGYIWRYIGEQKWVRKKRYRD